MRLSPNCVPRPLSSCSQPQLLFPPRARMSQLSSEPMATDGLPTMHAAALPESGVGPSPVLQVADSIERDFRAEARGRLAQRTNILNVSTFRCGPSRSLQRGDSV